MGKKEEKERKEAEERRKAFDSFYENIYKERWTQLKAALQRETTPVPFSDNLEKTYYLDKASVIAAMQLPLEDGFNVLDMCAAPGGKTLVLASRGDGRISITANDRSKDRRVRLDNVIKEHLRAEIKENIRTTNHDASRWGMYEKGVYDAVLLDAPCSSERHVLTDPKHLAMWSPSRPKRLAIEQFALLASALDSLKEGGYLLYSTCSINPGEDEMVIDKLLKRREGLVEEITLNVEVGEKKNNGVLILPDTNENLGPLYYCLLRKLEKEN